MQSKLFFIRFFLALVLLVATGGRAQGLFTPERLWKGQENWVALQTTLGTTQTPLWLNANRYGLASTKGNSAYLRVALHKGTETDTTHHWRLGYGLDAAVTHRYSSPVVITELYADLAFKQWHLCVGSKAQPMWLKNAALSTGGQTLGINARPIPEVRIGLPNYLNLDRNGIFAIQGFAALGRLTDGAWQRAYTAAVRGQYSEGSLLHTKAIMLRLGNGRHFPLTFEGGLIMATQYGGTVHNLLNIPGNTLHMGTGLRDLWHAVLPQGGDATDSIYANATGNTIGSWLFSLRYDFPTWSIRAYYDHLYEDHSQLFGQYGWQDGLLGVEISLPPNPWAQSLVYEYISTYNQTGPVYHDHTAAIPDQISGIDNYYNHAIYGGWQHWGQPLGNPLFATFLHNDVPAIAFTSNRYKAHHVGIQGRPSLQWDYRLLYTHIRSWGTYVWPYEEEQQRHALLGEVTFTPRARGKSGRHRWQVTAALGLDAGDAQRTRLGAQLTLRKTGLF